MLHHITGHLILGLVPLLYPYYKGMWANNEQIADSALKMTARVVGPQTSAETRTHAVFCK